MHSHKITSDWTPADESTNRLELAATDHDGLVAIRDTFDPERQIFATTRQVSALMRAADRDPIRRMLSRPAPHSARTS